MKPQLAFCFENKARVVEARSEPVSLLYTMYSFTIVKESVVRCRREPLARDEDPRSAVKKPHTGHGNHAAEAGGVIG